MKQVSLSGMSLMNHYCYEWMTLFSIYVLVHRNSLNNHNSRLYWTFGPVTWHAGWLSFKRLMAKHCLYTMAFCCFMFRQSCTCMWLCIACTQWTGQHKIWIINAWYIATALTRDYNLMMHAQDTVESLYYYHYYSEGVHTLHWYYTLKNALSVTVTSDYCHFMMYLLFWIIGHLYCIDMAMTTHTL